VSKKDISTAHHKRENKLIRRCNLTASLVFVHC
jgi:hypothetical protein